jgi:hypothetical protein
MKNSKKNLESISLNNIFYPQFLSRNNQPMRLTTRQNTYIQLGICRGAIARFVCQIRVVSETDPRSIHSVKTQLSPSSSETIAVPTGEMTVSGWLLTPSICGL